MSHSRSWLLPALTLTSLPGARGAAAAPRFRAPPQHIAAAAPTRARAVASSAEPPLPPPPGAARRRLRVAVVGDVHGQWDEGDAAALRALRPPIDLCLFVGDFGDEDVVTVEACARSELPCEAASIFGNHDAWFSLDRRKRRPKKAARDYGGKSALEAQRELLAPLNLEYARRELPAMGLSVVGGRPYSIGGPIWPAFYVEEYGLTSPVESADRIGRVAANAYADTLIFLAHNGPTGLGSKRDDICGRDWPHRTGVHAGQSGGDWGDRDLAMGIRMAHKAGKRVPLVAFGHLHRRLIGGGLRQMVQVDESSGTVYLNAAQVPRWRGRGVQPLGYDAAEAAAAAAAAAAGAGAPSGEPAPVPERKQHWFAIVEMEDQSAAPAESAERAGVGGAPAGRLGAGAGASGGVVGHAEEGDARRAVRREGEGLRVERVRACWVEADGTVAEEELWYCRQAAEAARVGAGGVELATSAASQRGGGDGGGRARR